MANLLSLPIGAVLVGDYRIEQVLGAGGFGVTYLARELAVDRYVTIKEYFPTDFAARDNNYSAMPRSQASIEDYQWGLDRFIDEAKTLGRFDHHNIVRLYRYFRANETAYMVLHFEEGKSLKSWLKSLGRTPRQQELDGVIAPLLDALDVIHRADFLHRDIAPDNIIIRADRTPVLIDFGSARGDIAAHTRTISALVKPGYSPYEQYAETGKKQGPWTDIYAFAGTLYHAVTGKRPPDAPSRLIKDELKSAENAAIGAFRKRFLRAIDQGLRLDTVSRPQSITAWREDLLNPDEKNTFGFVRRTQTRALPPHSPPHDKSNPANKIIPSKDAAVPSVKDIGQHKKTVEAANPDDKAELPRPAFFAPPKLPVDQIVGLRKRIQLGLKKKSAPPVTPTSITAVAPQADEQRSDAPAQPQAPSREPPQIFKKRLRPRPIRKSVPVPVRWRPLLFKLLIGLGIASGAVALQNQLPQTGTSETGVVLDSGQTAQNTQSKAALSVKTAAKAPPQLLLHRINAHEGAVNSASFAQNGKVIATAGADGTVKLWDVTSTNLIKTLTMDEGPATALATHGNLALTGHSDGNIALWNLDDGIKERSFKRNDARIWALAFAGSSKRFWSAGHDWSVALWEVLKPSEPLQVLQGHTNPVQALSYSPEKALLASGGADKTVRLWNGVTFNKVRRYRRMGDFISALGFSKNGDNLVAGLLDGDMRVMRTTRSRSRRIKAHNTAIVAVKFYSNEHFATASKDGSIKIWSTRKRRPLARLRTGTRPLSAMDISPDGRYIISADTDGIVTIWRMPL